MSDSFTIHCPSCQAEYELPESLREGLLGNSVTCENCDGPWIPLPTSGVMSKLRQPRQASIVLIPYLKSESDLFSLPSLEPSGGSGEASARADALPPRAPAAPVAPAAPSLRVMAQGPALQLDAVYSLGRRSFLVGKSGCHLSLPGSPIPERALRIQVAQSGLSFEGIGGFEFPLGAIFVQSGRIPPGSGGLTLELGPYRVVLQVSDAPGEAVADLEGGTVVVPLPQGDLRAQLKPLAPTPGGIPAAIEEPQATIRDLGATTGSSSHATWGHDVFQGFEVGLVGIEGRYKGKSFRVTKGVTLVGRTTGDLVIPDNRVSGKHAQLEVLGPSQYAIKDFASTNGTTVNDRPISQTALRNGDVIGFGGLKFKFVARPKS